jgi:hypothetical protein
MSQKKTMNQHQKYHILWNNDFHRNCIYWLVQHMMCYKIKGESLEEQDIKWSLNMYIIKQGPGG